MSQNRVGVRGSLPRRKPNRHRIGAWQPPLVYPKIHGKKFTRQEKSNMLQYYNSQLEEAKNNE